MSPLKLVVEETLGLMANNSARRRCSLLSNARLIIMVVAES